MRPFAPPLPCRARLLLSLPFLPSTKGPTGTPASDIRRRVGRVCEALVGPTTSRALLTPSTAQYHASRSHAMKTALALVLAVTLLPSGPVQGRWLGSVETPHGAAPLQLTVPASDSSAGTELTFMGATIRGAAQAWTVTGDSVSFGILFTTDMGAGEFRLAGRVVESTMSGTYVGLMGGQEMSRGAWSLKKQP